MHATIAESSGRAGRRAKEGETRCVIPGRRRCCIRRGTFPARGATELRNAAKVILSDVDAAIVRRIASDNKIWKTHDEHLQPCGAGHELLWYRPRIAAVGPDDFVGAASAYSTIHFESESGLCD